MSSGACACSWGGQAAGAVIATAGVVLAGVMFESRSLRGLIALGIMVLAVAA